MRVSSFKSTSSPTVCHHTRSGYTQPAQRDLIMVSVTFVTESASSPQGIRYVASRVSAVAHMAVHMHKTALGFLSVFVKYRWVLCMLAGCCLGSRTTRLDRPKRDAAKRWISILYTCAMLVSFILSQASAIFPRAAIHVPRTGRSEGLQTSVSLYWTYAITSSAGAAYSLHAGDL